MKRTLIFSAAICALLISAVLALGDIARPKPTTTPKGKAVLYTSLQIATDSKASEARLQISEHTLREIAKDAGSQSSSQSLMQSITHRSTRTILAGLFLFLAVSFAGVWFARSVERRHRKAIAAIVLVATFLGVATVIVRANAGPPGYIRWQNLPANLTKGQATEAGVDIEIVPGDDSTIKLIIPMRKTNQSGEE